MADQFRLVRFERSKNPKKKYDGIIEDKKTKKTQRVPFGSRNPLYEQYKDSTGLKLYSRLDHGDEKRRKAYKARHEKTRYKKWSPSWLSDTFLWT
jgi:hypothetical protein